VQRHVDHLPRPAVRLAVVQGHQHADRAEVGRPLVGKGPGNLLAHLDDAQAPQNADGWAEGHAHGEAWHR
jgi:hypothetical protein